MRPTEKLVCWRRYYRYKDNSRRDGWKVRKRKRTKNVILDMEEQDEQEN